MLKDCLFFTSDDIFKKQYIVYDIYSVVFLSSQLALKGSSYIGLLERHNIHTFNVGQIVDSLQ